jgi:hypothetical protein
MTGPRAAANTAVWLLKVFPMLPSRPVNWVTRRPVVERMAYPTAHGEAVGDLYRPSSRGPHPGVVVCLGVVPFGVDHPQVPRLGEALARAGFAALLYWSPAMRDFRLDPADVEDFASAYEALLARPDIDSARSGVLGTCVRGAFALMGAASPRIRDRVNFALAYAAYASMWSLARDIASASRVANGRREPWAVDPLTRKVFVHTLTALLEPREAQQLRDDFAERRETADQSGLSDAQRAIVPLLTDTNATMWWSRQASLDACATHSPILAGCPTRSHRVQASGPDQGQALTDCTHSRVVPLRAGCLSTLRAGRRHQRTQNRGAIRRRPRNAMRTDRTI